MEKLLYRSKSWSFLKKAWYTHLITDVFFRNVVPSLARFKGQSKEGVREVRPCQDNTEIAERIAHGTMIAKEHFCGTAKCY